MPTFHLSLSQSSIEVSSLHRQGPGNCRRSLQCSDGHSCEHLLQCLAHIDARRRTCYCSAMFLSMPTSWSSHRANLQPLEPSRRRPLPFSFGHNIEEDCSRRAWAVSPCWRVADRNLSLQCNDSHNCRHRTHCLARRTPGAPHALALDSVLLRCPRFGPPVVQTKLQPIPSQNGPRAMSYEVLEGNGRERVHLRGLRCDVRLMPRPIDRHVARFRPLACLPSCNVLPFHGLVSGQFRAIRPDVGLLPGLRCDVRLMPRPIDRHAVLLRPGTFSPSGLILLLSSGLYSLIRGRRSTRNAISCPRVPCVRGLLGGHRPEYGRSSAIAGRETRPDLPVPIPKASKFAGTQATRRQSCPSAACTCFLFPLIHPLPPIIDLGEKTQVAGVDIKGMRNHTISFPFSVGFSETIFWKILFGDESMVEWGSEKNIFGRKLFLFFYLKNI